MPGYVDEDGNTVFPLYDGATDTLTVADIDHAPRAPCDNHGSEVYASPKGTPLCAVVR